MKIAIYVLIGFIVIVAAGCSVLIMLNRPIPKEEVTKKIENHLSGIVEKNDSLSSALLTIYSKQTGYFEQFAVGTKNHSSDEPAHVDSQYHAASIGKTMCAVIFGMLVEEGKISYDDKVASWLDDSVLNGLFVVDGIDYADQVTIRQLLSHTSGVGDYFEGPVNSGQPLLQQISSNPELSFTPETLIAFTRDNQEAVGKPGQQFYYSDTGYILLGLMLEQIEKQPYAAILEEKIFKPLGMEHSYLMFYQNKPADILGLYINGVDIIDKQALSVDWAGGGVVTTMDDLLTFMIALEDGTLVSDEVYKQMTDFVHHYDKGIYYGMGMMYFDFSELSFLLGSLSDVYGGVGVTGTYVLVDKEKETFFIANFGSDDYTEKGIEELVKIRMIYDRMIVE
ncbi:beta-lactamase family protein [Paenibacillus sp. SC116]|uniref:serine hydrolase domain-containing protein n=1 Tax=Paenibacillus sp. SC116 TaxID=2968986 RepID=UPI00215B2D44|nr:serine hydrolase domain-containing protein [Paenibacillus sp. SC116]MCR8844461.1 beta-lactamase family protein [Paenibacillus sp. SC116]